MAQRRKPGSLKAARQVFWGHVPDWSVWDRLDGQRGNKLFAPAAPWKSRIRFEGGLKSEEAA